MTTYVLYSEKTGKKEAEISAVELCRMSAEQRQAWMKTQKIYGRYIVPSPEGENHERRRENGCAECSSVGSVLP